MGGFLGTCRKNTHPGVESSVVVGIEIGIDSTFYQFVPKDGMEKRKRGHPQGQLLIQIPSFEKEVLNRHLGELSVKVVST